MKFGELGNTNSVCKNDIKYCYKERFLEETQNRIVLVLVWCVSTDPIQVVPRLTETKPKYRDETLK